MKIEVFNTVHCLIVSQMVNPKLSSPKESNVISQKLSEPVKWEKLKDPVIYRSLNILCSRPNKSAELRSLPTSSSFIIRARLEMLKSQVFFVTRVILDILPFDCLIFLMWYAKQTTHQTVSHRSWPWEFATPVNTPCATNLLRPRRVI